MLLNRDLSGAMGIAIRGDGTSIVASAERVWYVKSDDSWGEGLVYAEVELDEGRAARDMAVGRWDLGVCVCWFWDGSLHVLEVSYVGSMNKKTN